MNIESYKKAVAVCIRAGLVPMGWGPPGVGKTMAHRELADAAGLDLKVLTGNLLTLDDLTGIPYRDGDRMVWSRPEALPDSGSGLLFVDEVSDCLQSIKKCLYSLILEHEVKGHVLPDGWAVSCAGNRPEDLTGSAMFPSALITR